MSRVLIVVMHDDLELHDPAHDRFPTTHDGVVLSCRNVNGVAWVDDAACISPYTLEEWLLPREQSLVPKRKRRKEE